MASKSQKDTILALKEKVATLEKELNFLKENPIENLIRNGYKLELRIREEEDEHISRL